MIVHVWLMSIFSYIDTTIAELIKNVIDKEKFREQIYTEQRKVYE